MSGSRGEAVFLGTVVCSSRRSCGRAGGTGTTTGDEMTERRLVGIDLGIASAHTVRVLDETGAMVAKRKAWPTAASLGEVEAAALAGCRAGTRLEVIVEPTGPAWLPIAVFFANRGHVVFRVSSQKAADLRRFLSRHTKTNGIDADTLARLALVDPAGLRPLQLPGPERAALDRRVRACDRLTRAGAEHKVRIKDLTRQLLPMTPLTGDLGAADLAVLERLADPNTLLKVGAKRLTAIIAKASHNHQGVERAAEWIAAAEASVELYAGHAAVAFADLAAEVATEVRLLRAVQADHARKLDPQMARLYWVQMVERGKDHLGALCVVAAHLAERAWTVLNRGMPYVICDTNGRPVTPTEAAAIIAEHWTVPADVRARRRSKKMGKAPQQVLSAQVKSDAPGADERGDLPHQPSFPDQARHVNRRTA